MNAKGLHPADRLRYLSDGLKDSHVRAIAQRLASTNNAVIPQDYLYGYNRTKLADWITINYSRDLIAGAHQALVQQYQATGGRAYVKGRTPGAKNRNKNRYPENLSPSPQVPQAAPQMQEWMADAGLEPAELADAPAPLPAPAIDLSAYALKTDVVAAAGALEVAMKDYCGTEFGRVHRVTELLEQRINAIKLNEPVRVVIEQRQPDNVTPIIKDLGVQHRHLPDLIAMCNSRNKDGSRLNVWLFGPAGTGKTTAAKMVSEALTPGRFFSLPAMESGFQILGYNDSHGRYQPTLFRECWENGGTIIMDESDSYSPSAALAANGALANGIAAFPDKMVPRHPDCIIIAGANTTGLGGTLEYSGRMKLDAAFMNRWVMLDWPIDDALEATFTSNHAWLEIVRYCRNAVITKQMKGMMVTPRATVYGTALLEGGLTLDRVMRSTIRMGMSDAQWNQVKPPRDLINACEQVRELFAA